MSADLPTRMKPSNTATSLLTISDWKAAQLVGGGLERLISLVEAERKTNSQTHAWISLASEQQLEQQWNRLQALGSDATSLPLYGVPFAAKDNIDGEGFPTTAACPSFSSGPAACDAPVVANLKDAGAILVGKTNLDQFATGLVGTRSPHGAVPNAFDPARVSGGSSSGSSVVVARGAVPFSLGTDTAGSGRVPAGLNNVIGLKPTRGALSARGVVPACRTLDCVSILTLTLADAETVLSVAEGYDSRDTYSRVRPDAVRTPPLEGFGNRGCGKTTLSPSFAICSEPNWFGRDDHAPAYDLALEKAKALGWKLTTVDFQPLFELAQLLYSGPWVAERYVAIKDFIENVAEDEMDPVVRSIIMRAQDISAADVFAGEYLRQSLTREIECALDAYDGLLVPTTPTFPTLEQVKSNPVEENSLLGTYTNFVNFLDWSALSIPAGFRPDGLPFGITLISNSWQEPNLITWARQWFGHDSRLLGATGIERHDTIASEMAAPVGYVRLAVVGAHLSGFPLNDHLVNRGAHLERVTTTCPRYRLFALHSDDAPKKAGLRRVPLAEKGQKIEVEVWQLPQYALASFMETVSSPLAIGSVQLEDETWVRGFVCEPLGLSDATDISKFGGWRAYIDYFDKARAAQKNATRPNPISNVLVANRGEIAIRIINTIHKMDVKAVAIYSDADADTAHVHLANVALRLTGTSVSETYLDIPQIINLAKTASVDAVIPGYGFLAENADFARAVEAAGMRWIGPTPNQMSELGLKHRARAIAAEADVPTIPGCDTLLTSLEEALQESDRIGFPLMLKSTAGGGGIGLCYCETKQQLSDEYDIVQRRATSSFGNGEMFLERFVRDARHIEVQILGDGKGNVITVGDRDCSMQRRHQKVIEESPASMVPEWIRESMKADAIRLASRVKYRNIGTVEFIVDVNRQEYFFLEVNTRLQVEHGVTESVSGLDLVECMLRIANDDADHLFGVAAVPLVISGNSIEVRLYAENPLLNFRPCAGRITQVDFPAYLRVDTWIAVGTEVTALYDPLLAKIIAHGRNRREALTAMARGLVATRVEGVETNLKYLMRLINSFTLASGVFTTRTLDNLVFREPVMEVLDPGALTTIQDFPGRIGYWSVGIPPSGPMDNYSFRLANIMVGNMPDMAGFECTLQGPSVRFFDDAIVAVTGGDAPIFVDNIEMPANRALSVGAGHILRIGTATHGYRMYIAVRAACVLVGRIMGSQSTFELGSLGGYAGRKLQRGDLLRFHPHMEDEEGDEFLPRTFPERPIALQQNDRWSIRVVPGPHGAPDFFTWNSFDLLFSSQWKVHHNSNRLGVRLTGPQPEWGRPTGGEAGLHPSNIHDSPYSVGSVSFTGDEAVVLSCDGPSLGGFVVFCVVASADMWKLGQLRPGDTIHFVPITAAVAIQLDKGLTETLDQLNMLPPTNIPAAVTMESTRATSLESVIVGHIKDNGHNITVRQAGERALLLEFNEIVAFNLRQSFKIWAFCKAAKPQAGSNSEKPMIEGLEQLTPGVNTLHVIYGRGYSPQDMMVLLSNHVSSYQIPSQVPSRTLHLPLAFDDAVSHAAIERYAVTIRSEAPWLPSNTQFLQKLNGIEDISSLLYDATFLVLGLGDVFMGSPCCVPLDPRHRLFGTKYNPSRSFTPRGAVGIGGQYMCIYATNSPGGYQLVGRTVEIWDPRHLGESLRGHGTPMDTGTNPWMFRLFDRIKFYPVTEEELDAKSTDELVKVEDGVLDLEDYEAWLGKNHDDIVATAERQARAIETAPFRDDLSRPYHPTKTLDNAKDALQSTDTEPEGEKLKATIPGRCYKCMVKKGDVVSKGDPVLCIESSKMEMEIQSPLEGICVAALVQAGDFVDIGDTMFIIKAE
ncbi:hypothetical protein G7046_g8993 [Stylonectria norvegica]|nr:hypothetical protein G7046_g8993 [Stylonectria norvegica]